MSRRVACRAQSRFLSSAMKRLSPKLVQAFEHEMDRVEIPAGEWSNYIPVVLTRKEINRVVVGLPYPYDLAIRLMYGCGLRLFECINLRVHCLNLDETILTVHDGKGKKDRTMPLPKVLLADPRKHLKKVEKRHLHDPENNYSGVFMPAGLDRKWKNAAKELTWQ